MLVYEPVTNEPEPSKAVRCASDSCGQSIIGYVPSWYSLTVDGYLCPTCAENEWQKSLQKVKSPIS